MTHKQTYIERLIDEVDNLAPVVDLLLDNSSIYYRDPNRNSNGAFYSFASKYHWQKKDEKTQVSLKIKYIKFYENFYLLLEKAHPQTVRKIKDVNQKIINLIEQNEALI